MNTPLKPNPLSLRYWRANTRLIRSLLLIWATTSLGFSILFVVPLNHFKLGTMPLGFWFAQQGSIYVFLLLILIYAVRMDALDRRYASRDQNQR